MTWAARNYPYTKPFDQAPNATGQTLIVAQIRSQAVLDLAKRRRLARPGVRTSGKLIARDLPRARAFRMLELDHHSSRSLPMHRVPRGRSDRQDRSILLPNG